MKILNRIILKRGKNLRIKRKKGNVIITNNSNEYGFIVFSKVFFLKNSTIKFESKMVNEYGQPAVFKLLSLKFNVIGSFPQNELVYESSTNRMALLGMTIAPKSKLIINDITLIKSNENEKNNKINSFFKGDTLLICPGYPSYEDKYNCAFIHTRVKEYKNLNMNIDVAHVNDEFASKTIFSEYEGIDVIRTGFANIRKVLRKKKYDKILIHFFNERHAQILDSLNLSDTQLYFYLHGAETLYWDWPKITTPYFEEYKEISLKNKELFKKRDEIIKKYNSLSNVNWMFVTPWTRKRSEELIGIKYNNSHIIPCYVDNKIFDYQEKDPELRKKIFVLRPFKNVATYSVDIDVLVILELSRRKIFNDLTFDVYGAGEMFDIVTEPIKHFKNVHLHNKFLSHAEISEMHKSHGIGLFATRYDSQAISCCEAALSGCAVVSTDNPGIKQEIYEKYNTLCQQESYAQYADVIERLYNNPDEFLDISASMSKDVEKLYNYDNTIGKELAIFDENKEPNKLEFKDVLEKPLLTVLIPAYNVADYLEHTLYSLVNNKNAHKLEVLVVNDGSKDETSAIAKEWEKITTTLTGSIVKAIDKPNGGHGSVINYGIKYANGKYFRIIDGDDTVDSKVFEEYLDILEHSDQDLVLTELVNDYETTNTKRYNKFYPMLKEGVTYHFDDLCYPGYGFNEWAPVLSTATYKTEKLRTEKFKVTEKMPYDDMEFNYYALKHVDTVVHYNMHIYNYLLGREGQTVSDASLKRNCDKHRVITSNIVKAYYNTGDEISGIRKDFLKKKIVCNMINSQYLISTEYFSNGKKFRIFNKFLKGYPELYTYIYEECGKEGSISRKKLKLHRTFNGFDIIGLTFIKKAKGLLRKLVR